MSGAPEASIIPNDIGDSIGMFGAFIAGNHFRVYEFMPAKGHEKMDDAGRVVETTRRPVSIQFTYRLARPGCNRPRKIYALTEDTSTLVMHRSGIGGAGVAA